ncbi:MAG: FAD-dependent oxidoreductase, partial [Candidatus Electrothrix sp. MAN1_4]|nr:FAD-dependent oxidoreductase [Candidatus Electrothrix sp. MAN1_4]
MPSLFIAGAGTAGIACALTAAQLGVKTVLLEKSGQIGGTVSRSLIHTLGGLFDDQGRLLNPGLSVELVERLCRADSRTYKRRIGRTWTLSVDPAVY